MLMVTAKKSSGFPCGIRPMANRVIGGVEARPHSWPWQCSILVLNQHLCGCAIVSPHWVISAAHCGYVNRFVFQWL